MATTVQVTDVTKQILDIIKKEESADSYDAIIYDLARKHVNVHTSMFGTIKEMRWKKSDRADFHEY